MTHKDLLLFLPLWPHLLLLCPTPFIPRFNTPGVWISEPLHLLYSLSRMLLLQKLKKKECYCSDVGKACSLISYKSLLFLSEVLSIQNCRLLSPHALPIPHLCLPILFSRCHYFISCILFVVCSPHETVCFMKARIIAFLITTKSPGLEQFLAHRRY
jgi:hypothetical protein